MVHTTPPTIYIYETSIMFYLALILRYKSKYSTNVIKVYSGRGVCPQGGGVDGWMEPM